MSYDNNRVVIPSDFTIKKSDLKIGSLYLHSDGLVSLYCGVSKIENDRFYCFYKLFKLALSKNEDYDIVIIHENIQLRYCDNIIVDILNKPIESESLLLVRTVPNIIKSLKDSYLSQESILKYFAKSKLLGVVNIPELFSASETKKSIYVSAKELQVGSLYFGGSDPWRSTFCYLGRTSDGGFLWCFIGNDDSFKSNPNWYITRSNNIEVTKSNKKVRLLTPDYNTRTGCSLGGYRMVLNGSTIQFLENFYKRKKRNFS